MRIKHALIIVFSVSMLSLSAQQTSPEIISTSGNYDSNANNSISWTIGELVIDTKDNLTNILTQGFHQDNYTITDFEDFDLNYQISVYPNPTTNHVFIQMNNDEYFQIYLFDLNGKLLLHSNHENGRAEIDLYSFAESTYLLKLYNSENKLIKSFKILKQ